MISSSQKLLQKRSKPVLKENPNKLTTQKTLKPINKQKPINNKNKQKDINGKKNSPDTEKPSIISNDKKTEIRKKRRLEKMRTI